MQTFEVDSKTYFPSRKTVVKTVWNLTCPLLFRQLVNAFVVPAINDYVERCVFLTFTPPFVDELDVASSYVLVAICSIRFVL